MIEKKVPLREVYVWQLPVRIFHWVNAFCITFLIITGLLITYPPGVSYNEGLNQFGFLVGYIRLTHLVLGVILIVNFLVRVYWLFAGNKFAKWYNYMPITKKQWRGIFETLKVDIFLLTPKPIYDIGHNSLAAVTYGGLFVMLTLQAITGLALWSPDAEIVGADFFQGVAFKAGGLLVIREIHFYLMWMFILFMIVHIYLVFYHDYIERTGIASSIIGGWKFIEEEIVQEYEKELEEEELLKQEKIQKKELKKEAKTENKTK